MRKYKIIQRGFIIFFLLTCTTAGMLMPYFQYAWKISDGNLLTFHDKGTFYYYDKKPAQDLNSLVRYNETVLLVWRSKKYFFHINHIYLTKPWWSSDLSHLGISLEKTVINSQKALTSNNVSEISQALLELKVKYILIPTKKHTHYDEYEQLRNFSQIINILDSFNMLIKFKSYDKYDLFILHNKINRARDK